MAVLVSACGADIDMNVQVTASGRGSVTLALTVPKTTAAGIEDLRVGLPVADLRRAGWLIDGPRSGPTGSIVVSATHGFSSLSQVTALVGDIAGTGPARGRPFRLTISEQKGTLRDRYVVSGTANLSCSMSCFDDSHLAATVGYPLGLSPTELGKLLGRHPAADFSFRFKVSLPGRTTASDAAAGPEMGCWSGRPGLVPKRP